MAIVDSGVPVWIKQEIITLMIGDERSLNINKQDVVYKRKGNRICESVLTI